MFSTNGWFVVKMNWTYCTHIPKWFHPNHHGQLQKPTGGRWNANLLSLGGRDGMDPQETWQGQRWKRKTWKVEEEGAGAQDYQPEAASPRSFGGGEEMVNFGPWLTVFPDWGMPKETALAEVRSSWGFQVFGSSSVWRTELELNRQMETTILIQNHTCKWTLPKS